DTRIGYEEPEDGGARVALPDAGGPSDNDEDPPNPDGGPERRGDSGGASDAGDGGGDPDFGLDGGVDAEVVDTGTDAGAAGSVCPTKDLVQQQACGLCGVQYRLCAPNDPNDSAAEPVWQPWGFCQNEVKDGCQPGTAATEGCGLCGTRNKVCQIDCRWAVGACKNEPANACSPGTEDYQVGLSCTAGGRSRTCQESCTYGPFSDCFVPGEPTLTLSATAGAKVSGQFKLEAANKLPRLGSSCPTASTNNTTTPYQYVVIANPTTSTIVASVWTSQSTRAGSGYIDTVVAAYAGSTKPTTSAERSACTSGVNDTCYGDDDPTECLSSWGGLVGSDAITIPPEGKALVYVGAWFDTGVGDYQLTARTDSVD
ncbi:MAG: hypothetical protein KF764_24420, partial [Labilithrix sp.]|nr:hypothetical protein [Labilithrix sp.]